MPLILTDEERAERKIARNEYVKEYYKKNKAHILEVRKKNGTGRRPPSEKTKLIDKYMAECCDKIGIEISDKNHPFYNKAKQTATRMAKKYMETIGKQSVRAAMGVL